MNVKLMV